MHYQGNPKRAILAAFLLGVGIAGLVDTIIFHQILQWHHMVSNKILPSSLESIQINVLWDGLFLAFALIVTILGISLLWNDSSLNKKDMSKMVPVRCCLIYLFSFRRSIVDRHRLDSYKEEQICYTKRGLNSPYTNKRETYHYGINM
jgi:uncharacterized membrane protein